jgi:hypothetical protein
MATATSRKSAETSNRPVHEIRLGRVKAAIWENDTLQRIYREGDEWRTSESFGRDDLPLIQKVADMAHTWIYQQGQESASSGRTS